MAAGVGLAVDRDDGRIGRRADAAVTRPHVLYVRQAVLRDLELAQPRRLDEHVVVDGWLLEIARAEIGLRETHPHRRRAAPA